MCILNHCSAQTKFFQTGFTDAVFPVHLTRKLVLSGILLSFLLSSFFLYSVPFAFSQETSDPDFQESFEEDPLTESDPDLGLEEDPLTETSPDLGMDEDPLAETNPDLGVEEDPLVESGSDLDMDEDPLAEESSQIGQEETPNFDESEIQESETQEAEQEEYQPKITFSHEVKTLLGGTETKGLSVLEPLLSEIKELRFVSTYEQSVKVQTSPRMYNYFRLSVSFSQNYELNKKRIFDGFASLREIYSNYRVGNHQIRYGTQIFGLGKVDLDKVINGIMVAKKVGLKIKINTVALKEINDDEILNLVNWCGENKFSLTFIEVMPMGEIGEKRSNQYMPLTEVKSLIQTKYSITEDSLRTGGPARYVHCHETDQKIGFITPHTHNFCELCNRVRITCTGEMYMCLGQQDKADLKIPLRKSENDQLLKDVIYEAISRKPKGHDFVIERKENEQFVPRHMNVTGG